MLNGAASRIAIVCRAPRPALPPASSSAAATRPSRLAHITRLQTGGFGLPPLASMSTT